MRWWRIVLAASAIWMAGAVSAAAAECPPGDGTTVVVDFAGLGGGVVARCAPTAATGFDALSEAGFDVTRVQANPAFVCRIDGLPGTETEDCVDIPPQSAFWSYWTAERGGDWRFQTSGAGNPITEDLEGWSFSAGTTAPPRFTVPAAPTTTTTTTPTTTTTTSTTTSTTTTSLTTTTTTPPTTTSTTTATTTTPSTTATSSTAGAAVAGTTMTSIVSPPSSTRTTPALPTTTRPPTTGSVPTAAQDLPPDTGSAGGFAAGLLAVTAVGAIALLVARRRDRQGGP